MIEMNLETLEALNKEIAEKFAIWRTAQSEYLIATSELAEAKYELARAIDDAYRNGMVTGKNERERDANLREILSDHHAQVDDLERKCRLVERTLRDSEIVCEQVRLQVTVARCINALVAI